MEKIKLGKYCVSKIDNVPAKDDYDIDYIDISSVDNVLKKVTGYSTYNIADAPSRAKQLLKKNDVLVSTVRPNLNAIALCDIETENVLVGSTGFCVLRGNEKVNSKYLFYFCQSSHFVGELIKVATGASYPAVSKNDVKNVLIPKYQIEKQNEIVETLDKASGIISHRKEQLKLLDDLVKSRFVELFGDPVVNNMGWDASKLKKFTSKIHSGNTPKGGSQVYVEKGIMFFRSQNVWKNRIELEDIAYIDEETHKSMHKSSLKYKDILMTKTGRINTENSSLGRAAMYMGEDNKANVNGHVYLIRINEKVEKEFVLFIITTLEYRDYIRSVCVGGIDKRQLNKDHIENFPIIMPPREKQVEFVKLWQQVDKLKSGVQRSLDETQILFDSLMQKYFD